MLARCEARKTQASKAHDRYSCCSLLRAAALREACHCWGDTWMPFRLKHGAWQARRAEIEQMRPGATQERTRRCVQQEGCAIRGGCYGIFCLQSLWCASAISVLPGGPVPHRCACRWWSDCVRGWRAARMTYATTAHLPGPRSRWLKSCSPQRGSCGDLWGALQVPAAAATPMCASSREWRWRSPQGLAAAGFLHHGAQSRARGIRVSLKRKSLHIALSQ
jgi:hypothetical protein